MKKISYLFSILCLMTLVVFTACKDDAPEETLEEKQTRFLTAGAFDIDEVELNPAVDYSFVGPGTITFGENNTFNITGNEALPGLVGSTEPFPATGTWAWKDQTNFDEVTLTGANNTGTVDLTLTSLSENALVFTYPGAEPKPDDEVEVTVTASK